MNVPTVRFNEWIKTAESSYVNIAHIMEIDLEPIGEGETYEVSITLALNDYWLFDKEIWERGPKMGHSLQISDVLKREVFQGTKAECTAIIEQMVDTPSVRRKQGRRRRYTSAKDTDSNVVTAPKVSS